MKLTEGRSGAALNDELNRREEKKRKGGKVARTDFSPFPRLLDVSDCNLPYYNVRSVSQLQAVAAL